MKFTVVICTHDRARLLDRLLTSLSAADKPEGVGVDVLVIANACSDDTKSVVAKWSGQAQKSVDYRVRFSEEPQKGKSHALNKALSLLDGEAAVFIDDDHRVDAGFLVSIARDLREYPRVSLFCGRILPDWDGREPRWVHDDGHYRLYPPPVPEFDQGEAQRFIENESFKPGGGNLIVRQVLLSRLGKFSTDLGPNGHNLAGGEDSEYLQRALNLGERLWYSPDILQYHYVDRNRLRLLQLMRMSYERSRASARIHHVGGGAPLYLWRKVAQYLFSATFSLNPRRTRFYLIRSAAALGEIRGVRDALADTPTNR
jgi:glycosyltransferase involved in cell wall biosynthesis